MCKADAKVALQIEPKLKVDISEYIKLGKTNENVS